MALQDLTPQLRTRLNRMERAVGWFILLATALLLFGFGYYIYKTAKDRGWFVIRAPYFTYAKSGAGISVGDEVKLMGFTAGHVTNIKPMPVSWGAGPRYDVYIEFEVLEPNFGYLWTEGSVVQFNELTLRSKRELNLTKGTNGHATYLTFPVEATRVEDAHSLLHQDKLRLGEDIYAGTNLLLHAWQPLSADNLEKISNLGISNIWVIDTTANKRSIASVWNNSSHHYEEFLQTNLYGLPPDEPPGLSDRLQGMLGQVETALPNFLQLTNQITLVLSNTTQLTSNLNVVVENVRPLTTNLNAITTHLRNPNGSLGEWLIPTNLNNRLDTTLASANGTLYKVDANLITLNRTLGNLGNITSNLNNQVQANSNILSQISDTVVHTDEFIQGMKRFWLFRRLFRTNAPPANVHKK